MVRSDLSTAALALALPLLFFNNIASCHTLNEFVQARQLAAANEASKKSSSLLAQYALEKVLYDASPIFGVYGDQSSSNSSNTSSTSTSPCTTDTSTWMKAYPDETLLVHMNIPGTHDAHTWNYSLATQEYLDHITDLNGVIMFPPQIFRCQQLSLLDQLNAGIRAFDLRPAADTTNSTLVFYHSQALDSETATLDDVLFGFYSWLDAHPSEVVLLSLQYEGSTKKYASFDANVQTLLHHALTTDAARHYFLQTKDELGTLGESRGKIILMRRFDLDQLDQSYTDDLPGLHFSPSNWTDNGQDIALQYNTAKNLTAYIEDYYYILAPSGSSAAENIALKYNVTTTHLTKAASAAQYRDSLFWSFTSSENVLNVPTITPQIAAIGNGTDTPGVNQQLVPFFKNMTGQRVGIVMFDFYDTPSDLITTLLSLQAPNTHSRRG